MRKIRNTCIVAAASAALVGLGGLGVGLWRPPATHAQAKPGNAPLKKSWGSVRTSFMDPRTREIFMVLEDTEGTVRLIRVYQGNGSRPDCPAFSSCVDVVYELNRE